MIVISIFEVLFFENERMHSIDQRLEGVVSSLIASGLSVDLINNLESTDDLISSLLGEEQIDQLIKVYSAEGKILAQNRAASEIKIPFDPNAHLETYEIGRLTVRALNVKHGRLITQVGVVLDFDWKRWSFLNLRLITFGLVVALFLFLGAYFGSQILFSPLTKLAKELEAVSSQLEQQMGQSFHHFTIGPELQRFSGYSSAPKEEFSLLRYRIENFLAKLVNYTRTFHAQTALLTHELKTPLTVLKNHLQEAQRENLSSPSSAHIQLASQEIDSLVHLINDYLRWSVLTSNPAIPDLHAVKLEPRIDKVIHEVELTYPHRIEKTGSSQETLFVLPEHLDQLIRNLLINACKYSPANQKVICGLEGTQFWVKDQGPGIPQTVLNNLGTPFNKGPAQGGSGLGLAWIQALCKKYGWELEMDTGSEGTHIQVDFTDYSGK